MSVLETRDVVRSSTVAVVPGKDVDERDGEPENVAALDHVREVASGLLDGPLLDDVVDAALDDQHAGPGCRHVEPCRDLVGALAVHAVVPEVERPVEPGRPPFPLAALVEARSDEPSADARAHVRVGIPQRRAGGDRVAEAGDDGGINHQGRRSAPAR